MNEKPETVEGEVMATKDVISNINCVLAEINRRVAKMEGR